MWELDGEVYGTLEQLQAAARRKKTAARKTVKTTPTLPPMMDPHQVQVGNLARVLAAITSLAAEEADSESTGHVDAQPSEGADQPSRASSEPAPTGPLGLEELRALGLPGPRPDWDADGDRWWRTTGLVDLESFLEPTVSTAEYEHLLGMEMTEEYWSEEQRTVALADSEAPAPRWTWTDIERIVMGWNAHVEARNQRERTAWAAGVKRRYERELLEALRLLEREAVEFAALHDLLTVEFRRHPEAFETENL